MPSIRFAASLIAACALVAGLVPDAAAEDRGRPTAFALGRQPLSVGATAVLRSPLPSPASVRRSLERLGARDVHVHRATGALDTASYGTLSVPTDAFTVNSMWADYYDTDVRYHIVFYGFWNFRDNYINGSDPMDASAVGLSGFSTDCWVQAADTVVVKDYEGNVHGRGTRYAAGHGKSIYEIDDRTSGFMMLTDNGIHTVDMRKRSGGTNCGGQKAGSYYYEHNQDGNGGWSASVSVGFFSMSYSGSSGSTLRKAAKYNYYS